MADKSYTAIFVPHEVKAAIKSKAKENGRTIIGELTKRYGKLTCPASATNTDR